MQKTLKIKDREIYRKKHFRAIEKFHRNQAKIPFEQKIDNLGSLCDIADGMREARSKRVNCS